MLAVMPSSDTLRVKHDVQPSLINYSASKLFFLLSSAEIENERDPHQLIPSVGVLTMLTESVTWKMVYTGPVSFIEALRSSSWFEGQGKLLYL